MARSVHETDPVTLIFEELPTCLCRPQDALLAFHSELVLKPTAARDERNEAFRNMSIQLVDDENPRGIGVGIDRGIDVLDEVDLSARRSDRRTDNLARDHIKVRHQRQRSMSDILELDSFNETRSHRFRFIFSLQSLHSSLFIGADHVCAFGREFRCIQVGVAELFHVRLILLGVLSLVLRSQPILRLVGPKARFAKKRST